MRSAEFEKIAELLARQHKIRVKPGEGWAADVMKREVFYKKDDIYSLPENHILGLLLHEIAHIHYTDPVASDKSPNMNKELHHSVLNMLEDIAIEHIISNDYPNAGEILAETKTEVLDTLVRILPTLECNEHEKAILYAATRFENRGYEQQFTRYEKVGDMIAQKMKSVDAKILDREKTEDLIPLTKELVEILLTEIGPLSERDKAQMQPTPVGTGLPKNGQEDTSSRQQLIRALGGKGQGNGETHINPQVVFVDPISDKSIIIGKQLRSVLKRNNAMEFGGRFRTGKLKTKSMLRVKTVKDKHPFSRRIIKSNQSYAFAIACDVSGSMYGGHDANGVDNAGYALTSMFMVGEALRIAKVPRSLIVFGHYAVRVNEINRLPIRWNQLIDQDLHDKANNGGTNIPAAIKMAREELEKERAERKVLVVLTDGASYGEEIKEEVKKAQKEGIECIGITVGYADSLAEALPKDNHHYIQDTSNSNAIGKAFIDILKSTIKTSPQ